MPGKNRQSGAQGMLRALVYLALLARLGSPNPVAAEITFLDENDEPTEGGRGASWVQDFAEFHDLLEDHLSLAHSAPGRGHVFLAGNLEKGSQGDREVAAAAAVDARTGAVKWFEESAEIAGSASAFGLARYRAVHVARNVAVLEGQLAEYRGSPSLVEDFFLEARDWKTGVVRWSEKFSEVDWMAAAVAGNRVYAFVRTIEDFTVLAFDARTGRELWRRDGDGAHHPQRIAAKGRHVVVAGYEQEGSDPSRFWMRVYDARSGEPQWEDHVGNPEGREGGRELVLQGRRVYVTSQGSGKEFGFDYWQLRVYDLKRRELLWDDRSALGNVGGIWRLLVDRHGIYACGSSGDYLDFVRAWSQRGARRWELVLDDYQQCDGLVVAGRRVGVSFVNHDGALSLELDAISGDERAVLNDSERRVFELSYRGRNVLLTTGRSLRMVRR